MLVLHVNWAQGALGLWAESRSAYLGVADCTADAGASRPSGGSDSTETSVQRIGVAQANPPAAHPFALLAGELAATLVAEDLLEPDAVGELGSMRLRLPCDPIGPRPSDRLGSAVGALDQPTELRLGRFEIPTVALPNDQALSAVLRLEDRGPTDAIDFGHSLRYWITVARFVLELLADQRFIPTLIEPQSNRGGLRAAWRPWLHDESAQVRLGALLAAMPPVVRAVVDGFADEPWRVLHDALATLTDATVRRALIGEDFIEAIRDHDPSTDPQVAWLAGLLGHRDAVVLPQGPGAEMVGDIRVWISQLEDVRRAQPFRLCFRLDEPPAHAVQDDLLSVDEDVCWQLSLHLVMDNDPRQVMVDARRVWKSSPSGLVVDGHHIDRPAELLLAELGRASRIYPKIAPALSEAQPSDIALTTAEAADFLRDYRSLLQESGFDVIVPRWWDEPACRLGVRLQVDAPASDDRDPEIAGDSTAAPCTLGLNSLVRYRWQIAIGDQPLSVDDLRQLEQLHSPLVRIGRSWVHIARQDIANAAAFVQADRGGEISLLGALRMAQGVVSSQPAEIGLPVLGMDAAGWVGQLLDPVDGHEAMPQLDQPRGFVGTLRPYQKTGLSWLAFLERYGLGACLADDMGLGKTIQLIALLLYEREEPTRSAGVGPTLLVVPTSLIGNWVAELRRFAPSLSCHVHHGPQRSLGGRFVEFAAANDMVITTYALVPRDHDTLMRVRWWRVVLDEAQFIKNPPTQQATAIRQLPAQRRVAMTGTPVENRLNELWSIMEFCNPGYLGGAREFRRRFAVPVERHRDHRQAEALRNLVRPFVLRRLKIDPEVIVDLPACVQTKEYATLTAEQAGLYQAIVDEMLVAVDRAEGIQRRGLVLATLTRLKQVCNHPAHLLQATGAGVVDSAPKSADHRPLSARSGKCTRLIEMLEELTAAGDKALVFTQFRQMGHLLAAMIRHDLDCEAMFLHGGTPPLKRQPMIDRFQGSDGAAPIFILSLKAGGIGLNLTAANHVFHFDRWWNPAVENQATDRAYRIGQSRTVHVHKFVCVGTLEEHIDQMIEQKTHLADNVIGSGEQWVTELTTEQLHETLRLRATALEVDP